MNSRVWLEIPLLVPLAYSWPTNSCASAVSNPEILNFKHFRKQLTSRLDLVTKYPLAPN